MYRCVYSYALGFIVKTPLHALKYFFKSNKEHVRVSPVYFLHAPSGSAVCVGSWECVDTVSVVTSRHLQADILSIRGVEIPRYLSLTSTLERGASRARGWGKDKV